MAQKLLNVVLHDNGIFFIGSLRLIAKASSKKIKDQRSFRHFFFPSSKIQTSEDKKHVLRGKINCFNFISCIVNNSHQRNWVGGQASLETSK